jgi:hypothetical protein
MCESGGLGCQNDRAEGKSQALAPSMFGLRVSTDLCLLSPERVSQGTLGPRGAKTGLKSEPLIGSRAASPLEFVLKKLATCR